MKDPQELYWELKKEFFDVLKKVEEADEEFADLLCDNEATKKPMDYETAVLIHSADETIVMAHEAFIQISNAHLSFIYMQLEELNEAFGPLKEFHPDLIDSIFTSDIKPLWPNHKTMQ